MEAPTAEFAIKTFLKEMRRQLDEAVQIAKAAEACADTGNLDKAVEIALDVEQRAYDANKLLDAASLINRFSKS